MHSLRVGSFRNILPSLKRTSIRHFGVGSKHTTFAVALDVDGVLYRGGEMIPGADEVLKLLHKREIPHILLTNGGGHTEKWRAEKMCERFGVDHLTEDHIQLAHTPMRELATEALKDETVLAVGKAGAKNVLESYGFTKVITIEELHALYPLTFPDIKPEEVALSPAAMALQEDPEKHPMRAVFCIMDPLLWSRELQIVTDVVRSTGVMGTLIGNNQQQVPLYLSCPDLEYVNEWKVPRYGAGTFGMCLEHLYEQVEGKKLEYTIYGKPNVQHYAYATQMLEKQASNLGYSGVHQCYGIGDNPLSDIAGANAAGNKWASILTCTGMYTGGVDSNDQEHPASKVVEDVKEALTYILCKESLPDTSAPPAEATN